MRLNNRRAIANIGLLCLITSLALPAALSLPALADESSFTGKPYTIPAGPLGPALSSFAGKSGVSVSFDPSLTQGKTSPGLQGHFNLNEASKPYSKAAA